MPARSLHLKGIWCLHSSVEERQTLSLPEESSSGPWGYLCLWTAGNLTCTCHPCAGLNADSRESFVPGVNRKICEVLGARIAPCAFGVGALQHRKSFLTTWGLEKYFEMLKTGTSHFFSNWKKPLEPWSCILKRLTANPEVIYLICTYSTLGITRFLPIYFQLFVQAPQNQPRERTCFPLCLCLCCLHRAALQPCPWPPSLHSHLSSIWSRALLALLPTQQEAEILSC